MKNKKPEIVILVGNIGSGKSTLIKKIILKGFSHINISRDDLRYMIGAGKYRFDAKLESAIWKSELNIIVNFMKLQENIIIDGVGVYKKLRERYIKLAKEYNYSVTVIEMPRLSKKICVDRRMKNSHQQGSKKLWESIWDKFNDLYEEPTKKEGINKIIKVKEK